MGGGDKDEVIDGVPVLPEFPDDPGNKNPGDGNEDGKRLPGNENLFDVVDADDNDDVSFSCLSTSARSSTGG